MAEADRHLLDRWNFLRGYQNNWESLVYSARAVFRAAVKAQAPQPRPDELVEGIAVALLTNEVFKQLCRSKREYADRSLDLAFARAMARHILDANWPVIVG